MDIFESLENLNVSEECFEDIVSIVEMYVSTSSRVRKMKPGNPKLLRKAWDFDQKLGKIFREKLEKGGKEAEEANRGADSREEILQQQHGKPRSIEDFNPRYRYYKKLAKTALKTKAPGTKRNTRIIRNAKQGSHDALSDLGRRIHSRNKNGKGNVSYNSYNKTSKDDLMDVIARKSPGVSFTSDEWYDNY